MLIERPLDLPVKRKFKLIADLMSSLHDLCQVTELRLSPKLQFLVRYGIISLETKSFTAPVRKLWVVPKFLH